MSKRNKKKLKKILQAQMMQKEKRERQENSQPSEVGETKTTMEQPQDVIAQEVPEVGREIRKILITVFLLVAVVIVIYLINIKTDLILKIGNYLTKTLNINV